MLATRTLSAPTVAVLLISCVNLGLVAFAAAYRDESESDASGAADRKRGGLSLVLVTTSQLVYLLFVAAWLFRWMRFYSGNPVENCAILSGLLLSVAAAVTAVRGAGLRLCASLFVSATTTGLWLLAAIASSIVI
jgi:hypothetical protein